MRPFQIDPDISRAHTLPSALYTDADWYRRIIDRALARCWHLLDCAVPKEPSSVAPVTLLPGSVDEPLLLTRDKHGTLRCLSNVCTHRGNLLVTQACAQRGLRCGYHGRRFALDGSMLQMPEFEGARDFPGEADNLPEASLQQWGPLAFASVSPAHSIDAWLEPVRARMDWFDMEGMQYDESSSRDYEVAANFALYCDNYLEGFHVPYVHPGLARTLSYADYSTELLPFGTLQTGVAAEGEAAFELPAKHPDAGRRIAAYYFFLFPCTMLNFYPFGLSVNVVQPLGVDRTRVRFLSYVFDASAERTGAAADLHGVEMEDEEIVARVQQGVRARLYDRGRYSPSREAGVHHFHRLLADMLHSDAAGT